MKKSLFILIASLFLGGSIYAQTSHFPDPSSDYDQHSDIMAYIQIDGEYITFSDNYENFEVGSFVDGECRGHAFLYDYGDTYPVTDFLPIKYALENPTGDVTFKLYDHTNGWEYTLCTSSTTIVIGHDYFGIDEEYPVFSFTTPSYTLDITGYGDNTAPSNYYLIASPVGTVNVADVSHMADNDFDLYYFDQAQEDEWINYEQGPFSLDPGTGYLYASKNDVQLVFKGFYTGDGKVTLKQDLNGNNVGQGFLGWNLVGNPYATEATIDRSFYKMNGDATGGTGLLATAQTGSIDPMMGIFVLATTDGEVMTFAPATSKASSNMVNVELSKENGSIMDRVIVRFGDGDLLPKIQLFEGTSKNFFKISYRILYIFFKVISFPIFYPCFMFSNKFVISFFIK